MLALALTPTALSLLVLAAHFLRRGQWLLCLVLVGVAASLFLRRAWVPLVVQVALALAALVWIQTLVGLVRERQAAGEPVVRLVAILGSVFVVNAVGLGLMRTPLVARHFAGGTPPPPAA
jgi:hypothetical protein